MQARTKAQAMKIVGAQAMLNIKTARTKTNASDLTKEEAEALVYFTSIPRHYDFGKGEVVYAKHTIIQGKNSLIAIPSHES